MEHLRRRYADHVPGLLGARHSYAVLCPLVERPDGLHLLFEVRSAALHRQPGECVSPGAGWRRGDAEQCALRETEEELAIPVRRWRSWAGRTSSAIRRAF
ncbi:MAG: NUDIX domain-containing protein [Dysosmobacter welbionis]